MAVAVCQSSAFDLKKSVFRRNLGGLVAQRAAQQEAAQRGVEEGLEFEHLAQLQQVHAQRVVVELLEAVHGVRAHLNPKQKHTINNRHTITVSTLQLFAIAPGRN